MTSPDRIREMLLRRQGAMLMPRVRTLEGELPIRVRYEGHVTVELIHAASGLIKRRLQFKNLVVDSGLQALFSTTDTISNLLAYVGVGTSGVAPAAGQTDLLGPVLRTATSGGADVTGWGAGNAYAYRRISRQFSEAEANGTLAEFGVFKLSAAGPMWARQLFKDNLGAATTITKTATDQLRIIYELRAYIAADGAGTLVLTGSGTSHDWTSRMVNVGAAAGITHHTANIGTPGTTNWGLVVASANTARAATVTTNLTGAVFASSVSTLAYVASAKYRDRESVWEPGVANFAGGVGSAGAIISNAAFCDFYFASKILKDATKRLRLTSRWSAEAVP